MHKLRGALRTVLAVIRSGAFSGNHYRADAHTLATTGFVTYPLTGGYADHAWAQQEPEDDWLEDGYDSLYEADDEPF